LHEHDEDVLGGQLQEGGPIGASSSRREDLVSSRLLTYEVWNRINAHGLMISHGSRARGLLARVNLTEMSDAALGRALEPFPVAVRTLDALHLATMEFLRNQGDSVTLASYDNRLRTAAQG
jgi:hypothetical protein